MADLYKVDVEQTFRGSVWIEADSTEEAEEGAVELFEHDDPEVDIDTDAVFTRSFTALPDHVWRYWAGGETGDWVHPRGRGHLRNDVFEATYEAVSDA